MKRIELLAPAGNLEKVKWAFMYGADAVYLGGRDYSLRANADNLSIDEIKEACDYAHNLGKKVYVTTNIVFHNEDFNGLEEYLKGLYNAGVDAVIVSDPSVISLIKEVVPNLEIHISTQQNTLNYEVCNFWNEEGAKRVVLGRETSKEDMLSILKNSNIDIEVFIQGAMCVSYSGRCVLSNYFTNRDANRGGCAQICRWDFDLIKDGKKIDTDTKFTMCSKDLCMLREIPQMIDIGICSLKVEGRMRSIYYVATVINTYRRAIDDYYKGILNEEKIEYYIKVLNRVANRDSCPQFFNKFPEVFEQYFLGREEVSNQDFLGIVDSYQDGYVSLISKNYFEPGWMVEIISPNKDIISFELPSIYDSDGKELDASRHPEKIIKFNCLWCFGFRYYRVWE